MTEKKSSKWLSAITKATIEIVVAQSSIHNSYQPGQNNMVSVGNTEPIIPSREEKAYYGLQKAKIESKEGQEEMKKGIQADKLRNDTPQNLSNPPSNDIKKGFGTHSKIQSQVESHIKNGQNESKSSSKGRWESTIPKTSQKTSSEIKDQGKTLQSSQVSSIQSTGQSSSPQTSQKALSENKGHESTSQSSQKSSFPATGQSGSEASATPSSASKAHSSTSQSSQGSSSQNTGQRSSPSSSQNSSSQSTGQQR
ncbi:hypothetical protein [uncultured Algoriphagus sp.]|uniref:hypothetical protein n=1 Tax=uncultured Algoriphagus sp. TaxID=417365 RepID=UPI0030ED358C